MSGVGWVIAAGSLTFLNDIYTQPEDVKTIDYVKIPVATAVGVGIVSLIAKASPELAGGLAFVSFVTVALAPVNGKQSPVTSVVQILQRLKVVS